MIDKELKDWCETCKVEPPAMRFKCPECEHNPDKEQIIIDGVDILKEQQENKKINRNCKYYHPNNKCGLKAWCMLNAKKCNVNADYCQLKLRKQLARKTQEYNELTLQIRETQEYSDTCAECKDDIFTNVKTSYSQIEVESRALAKIISSLKSKTQECEQKDERIIELTREGCRLTQECEQKQKIIEELKKEAKRISANYIKDEARYRKALEEIEEIVNEPCIDTQGDCKSCGLNCEHKDILNIINKAKGEEDE